MNLSLSEKDIRLLQYIEKTTARAGFFNLEVYNIAIDRLMKANLVTLHIVGYSTHISLSEQGLEVLAILHGISRGMNP